VSAALDDKTLRIVRVFNAPRERVFDAWIVQDNFIQWMCPPNVHVSEVKLDVRPGGAWHLRGRNASRNFVTSGKYVEIKRADGTSFLANQYIVENGPYREVMIYWYQGRGRAEASEYIDKLHTIWDSVTRGRSDGAFVRVVINIVGDEDETAKEAAGLSASLADTLPPFVPE